MRTIGICIPVYNRFEMLFEAFEKVHDDERISAIIVTDDASDYEIYRKVKEACVRFPKVKLYRNLFNRDCYENKRTAISYSPEAWNILLDSDNIIDTSYLDRLYEIEKWEDDTCYQPSFAAPAFNFEELSGLTLSANNVSEMLNKKMADTMLNAMNYFVHKNTYLRVHDGLVNPHTADSILMNYNWFRTGNKMYVVPGLTYQHRIHSGSHYQLNNHKTGNLYEEILQKLRELK